MSSFAYPRGILRLPLVILSGAKDLKNIKN